MNFIPVSLTYLATVQGHDLCADVHYHEFHKIFDFYFDDKKISSKTIPNDMDNLYQKDDATIDAMIKEYCANNKGILSDIFARHADKVKLKSKEIKVNLKEAFVELEVSFLVKKDLYVIVLHTTDDSGKVSCEIKADSFSDVLEKMRLFSGILGSANDSLGKYIDSLSRDELKDKFEWYEEE